MKNDFQKIQNKKLVDRLKKKGIGKDLAERVYTSHLLGSKKDLVLHGGGNTSVKSILKDIHGEYHDIIYVKGSGSDLSTIKPEDFPAVKLEPLKKIIKKKIITDEEMISFFKRNLINFNSPNPSVETLVHSIIKEKFVDHTHSNAILEITNRKDGQHLCKKIFKDEIIFIPYVMPGFPLARKVYELYKKNSRIKGMILYRHGIFTFGPSAKESYDRMINLVSKAERYLKSENSKKLKKIKTKKLLFKSYDIASIIRGSISRNNNYILNFRSSSSVLEVINSTNAKVFLNKGVVTPDHVIRIKPKILLINIDACKSIKDIETTINKKVLQYIKSYSIYFKKYNKINNSKTMLDPIPQIIAVQHLGFFSVGKNFSEAIINGDIGETAIRTIGNIEMKTSFSSIGMKEIFDVEYWSLEQAKLNKSKKPLSGKITVVTGGTGIIGQAIAKKFKKMGSEVIIIDINKKRINEKEMKNNFSSYFCDVRKRSSFKNTLKLISEKFGGIDIMISNAGNAMQHEISTLPDVDLKNSFETNFFSHQIVASESVEIMKKQKLGGCLLFNISKQSINPGVNFGAYGLPKSALLALCKQYALEYGHLGIRSNGINADRVESGLLTKEMLIKRARSRKISTKNYLSGNLLKKQVLAEDVAEAFYNLSISNKTTAAVLTVDGGNIEASMR